MVAEALEEHQQAKMLLNELEGLGSDNHDFGSKLQRLMEAVEHHVEGGKRDVSKIREVFDEDELKQLGEDSAKGTAHRKAG